MKSLLFRNLSIALSLAATALALPHVASAQNQSVVIIEDTFTTSGPVVLNGRTPPVSLSGNKWQAVWLESSNSNSQPYLHTDGSLRTRFNGAGFIDISSNGSYTKPSELTISADLTVSSLSGGPTDGIGLGFFSSNHAVSGGQSNVGFTGLVLSPNGTVNFMSNGSYISTYGYTISQFSATAIYNLSYTVDTSSGGITSATLNGVQIASSFSDITAFTDAATLYAGFFGRSGTYASSGIVDNFKVTSSIPESNVLWLALGVAACALVAKRRMR